MSDQKEKPKVVREVLVRDLKHALVNYKKMHEHRAKDMGVYKQFMEAQTLTKARRIVFP